jgi:hypothetical protein
VPPRAEQTLGQRLFFPGRTTDQDKPLACPAANRVQRVGDKGLARACFTVDQHMAIGLPQIQDILTQPLHHGGLADQLFHQLPAVRQFATQRAVVHGQTAHASCLFGELGHAIGIERLFQKIKCTDTHRFDRHGHIAVAGDHNNRQGTVTAHQLFQKLHPVHAGHFDV